MRAPAGRDLRDRVHRRFVEQPPNGDATVRGALAELLRAEAPLLTDAEFARQLCALHDEVRGLGRLERLLADPEITEVMVNGGEQVYVERRGALEAVALRLDADEVLRVAERVVAPLGLRLDRASPIVDARLADGSRLHAVIPPLALDGPCLTIRRFARRRPGLDAFGCSPAALGFLRWSVVAGWNLVVSGGTGSGKTTLVQALASAVAPDERLVTIEETAELALGRAHVVRLEARPPNAEGVGEVSVRDLVRAALRMRPDRLVVGEVRGAEALDLLQALNTGHDGAWSTVHANDPAAALRRIETLAIFSGVLPLPAVRAQIAAAVDAVVQVERSARGARRVAAIAEVDAHGEQVRPLFVREGGACGGDALVGVERPRRPPRRVGVAVPDPAWFGC